MVIQFDNPWLLLMLIPAAALVFFTAKGLIRLTAWRRAGVILLRGLVFLLVVLLLSGLTLRQVSDRATTLFMVDSSDSVGGKERAADFVREAIRGMGRNDEAGIINFGESAFVELPAGKNPVFDELQTRVDPSFTNIEKALLAAQSLMPWDHKKRAVLLSDGRENAGDALRQVRQMRDKGYVIDVYPLDSEIKQEVQLQELKVPASVNLNEQFELTVTVESNVRTEATLQLYSGRVLTARKEVLLNKGTNQFAFSDKAVRGGTVTYRAEVTAASDTVIRNNALSAFTYVTDVPEILILQEGAAGRELEEILKADMHVTVQSPKQAPTELSELLRYDAFILANVSADSLSDAFLKNLETAVSHQGKGLLVTGGDNSYGPGGYYATALEKILPVNMDIKPGEEEPNLALLLVIDKSGSMASGDYGIEKMELAREAAIRSTEVLKQDDMIGVLAFDDAYKWVVAPQKTDNLKAIQDAIGTIRAGGGTQILPPLEEAFHSIQDLDAKLKHIILLTDGQAEKEGYEPVIDGLRGKGITLSTVAVGREADSSLMRALALGGRGRFYQTDEFTDIPKIFAKEVFLAGKKYLVNRTFTPALAGSSELLKGIDAVPQLDGYVATTAKGAANVIFASDQGDPVLASWQYGLGRTVAWTPDAQGIWTGDWMAWESSPKFWKNIISWLVQQNLSRGYTVESDIEGQEGIITVKAEEDAYMTADKIEGRLIGPDGAEREIKLDPIAPGEYRGSFTGGESGVYIADLTLSGSGGRSERISAGLAMPYSPEYDLLSSNGGALLQKIANEGGGRILESPAQAFEGGLPSAEGITDPSLWLLIAVLILFLADVALRRLSIRPGFLKGKLDPVLESGRTAAGRVIRFAQSKRKGRMPKDSVPKEKGVRPEAGEKAGTAENHTAGGSGRTPASHVEKLLEKKRNWTK
jgi:Mg-chelatase subunit ChlD